MHKSNEPKPPPDPQQEGLCSNSMAFEVNRCSRQLSSCQLPSTCRPPKLASLLSPWLYEKRKRPLSAERRLLLLESWVTLVQPAQANVFPWSAKRLVGDICVMPALKSYSMAPVMRSTYIFLRRPEVIRGKTIHDHRERENQNYHWSNAVSFLTRFVWKLKSAKSWLIAS